MYSPVIDGNLDFLAHRYRHQNECAIPFDDKSVKNIDEIFMLMKQIKPIRDDNEALLKPLETTMNFLKKEKSRAKVNSRNCGTFTTRMILFGILFAQLSVKIADIGRYFSIMNL